MHENVRAIYSFQVSRWMKFGYSLGKYHVHYDMCPTLEVQHRLSAHENIEKVASYYVLIVIKLKN